MINFTVILPLLFLLFLFFWFNLLFFSISECCLSEFQAVVLMYIFKTDSFTWIPQNLTCLIFIINKLKVNNVHSLISTEIYPLIVGLFWNYLTIFQVVACWGLLSGFYCQKTCSEWLFFFLSNLLILAFWYSIL